MTEALCPNKKVQVIIVINNNLENQWQLDGHQL